MPMGAMAPPQLRRTETPPTHSTKQPRREPLGKFKPATAARLTARRGRMATPPPWARRRTAQINATERLRNVEKIVNVLVNAFSRKFGEIVMALEFRKISFPTWLALLALSILFVACKKADQPSYKVFVTPDDAGNALIE